MGSAIVNELKGKVDAAWGRLTRQLQGMEPHMERSPAPGEWTLRHVLAHLLFEPGRNPVEFLRKFSRTDLPPGEVNPGQSHVTPERERMTLREFLQALDAQRRSVVEYLDGLTEADLTERKARIPVFKRFMGTDEISIQVYVSAFFDLHWNDHAGQIAKIRQAVGLREAK